MSNLGYGLRVADCDGDGFKDLLVLSPFSQENGDQRGQISVFTAFSHMKNQTLIDISQA